MKKKKIVLLMCIIMSFLLCACGKAQDVEESQSSESTVENKEAATEIEEQTTVEDVIPEDYAASVIVTINPQVKLYLDKDNVVIGVEYLNEDAKAAFAKVKFSDVTIEVCIDEMISAAVESEFLTDGKDVSIEISEIKDESIDSEKLCEQVETVVIAAVEENKVEANVTAKVSSTDNNGVTAEKQEETGENESESVSGIEETKPTEPEPTEAPVEPAKEDCEACGGTGVCPECGGGITTCKRCGGTLWEACVVCKGNITITCQGCRGSGLATSHETGEVYEGEPCNHCGGAGIVTCDQCGGAGGYTCMNCNGTGKMTLGDSCILCHGGKSCTTCGGTGKVSQ